MINNEYHRRNKDADLQLIKRRCCREYCGGKRVLYFKLRKSEPERS